MIALFSDYTLRTVALGSAVLGALAGGLGSFALLRRQSLLGDAVSHAALPGIALAFILTGSKSPLVLLLGAGLAGWLAILMLTGLGRVTRVKEDAALGLLLSVMFGFGMVLLTFIQKRPDAGQAGLDRFLFGQAAALLAEDVLLFAVLGAAALAVIVALWKELKILCFDADFAAALGLPVGRLELALMTLLVVAIVVGLQTVGVVLVSALVVAPAAAARQWTDRLSVMAPLAALFGAVAGTVGAVVSSVTPRLPTGPTVVVALAVIAVGSLLLAPARGLIWAGARRLGVRRRLRGDAVLANLLRLARQHAEPGHGHDEAALSAMHGGIGVRRSLRRLEADGLVARASDGGWALTPNGRARAEAMLERLEREAQ